MHAVLHRLPKFGPRCSKHSFPTRAIPPPVRVPQQEQHMGLTWKWRQQRARASHHSVETLFTSIADKKLSAGTTTTTGMEIFHYCLLVSQHMRIKVIIRPMGLYTSQSIEVTIYTRITCGYKYKILSTLQSADLYHHIWDWLLIVTKTYKLWKFNG